MSDYILLLDPSVCPACRRRSITVSGTGGICRNCGMILFMRPANLTQYEADTGWMEYWVFTGKAEGWKHRSQIFSANPLHRVYEAPRLDSDYGTVEYNRRQLENAPERQELKREIKRLRKKPVTVSRI